VISALLAASLMTATPAGFPGEFSVYANSGLTLLTSNVRTQGGLGGGLGVRDTLLDRWIFQADVEGLAGLGAVLSVRVGAGVQRQGWWTPALLVYLTGLFGDRLSFPTSEAPTAGWGPGLAVGLTLAPLRFRIDRVQLSLLEVSVGVGPDAGGAGQMVGLTLLEVGASL